jgi:NTE family protein
MGNDMMSRDRLEEIIQESFLAAGRRSAEPATAELIAMAAEG